MLLETLIIAVVIAFVLAKVHQRYALKKEKASQAPVQAPSSADAAPREVVRRVLAIDGTEPFKGQVEFVRAFGIAPSEVSDLRYFQAREARLETLPSRVRDCLAISYREGLGRGLEVPAMLEQGRVLGSDEALYFALVQRPRVPAVIMAFVDKVRPN